MGRMQVKNQSATWTTFNNSNNVYGRAHNKQDTPDIKYLGEFDDFHSCQQAANTSSKGPFNSFTYHTKEFHAAWARQCYGVVSDYWSPTAEQSMFSVSMCLHADRCGQDIISARKEGRDFNIWSLDLSSLDLDYIYGLRVNSKRAVRAKYPNGNPELTGPSAVAMLQYEAGWVTDQTGS